MQIFVKIMPLKAGTSEAAGDPELLACPPDVEPETILSFLSQKFGRYIETVLTSTERHQRIQTGWIFRGPTASPGEPFELACVPLVEVAGGSLRPMFELQADQRQDFGKLASDGTFRSYSVIGRPLSEYQPPSTGGEQLQRP